MHYVAFLLAFVLFVMGGIVSGMSLGMVAYGFAMMSFGFFAAGIIIMIAESEDESS